MYILLYIMLHLMDLKTNFKMDFIGCSQVLGEALSWLQYILHFQTAWCSLPSTISRHFHEHLYILSNVHFWAWSPVCSLFESILHLLHALLSSPKYAPEILPSIVLWRIWSTLLSILLMMLSMWDDDTLSARLTISFHDSFQDTPIHTSNHALKDTTEFSGW